MSKELVSELKKAIIHAKAQSLSLSPNLVIYTTHRARDDIRSNSVRDFNQRTTNEYEFMGFKMFIGSGKGHPKFSVVEIH